MVLEAGYPNTTGFRKVVKATIMVKKKEGVSDEDFIEHYNKKHAQLAAPVLLKHNIITYSLVCNPTRSSALPSVESIPRYLQFYLVGITLMPVRCGPNRPIISHATERWCRTS